MGLEDVNEVPQVPVCAVVGRPADGAELPDIDVNMVALLKGDHRLERPFELGLVPLFALDQAGIAIGRSEPNTPWWVKACGRYMWTL